LTLFGRALLTSGDDDAAFRALEQAAETLPVDPMAFYFLADAAERAGNVGVARRALLDYQALEGEGLDPRRRTALTLRIGDLSLRAGDFAAAISFYQRAAGASSDVAILLRLAEAHLRARDLDGARAAIERVLAKEPDNRSARALLLRLR
jgi:predicted TPR repeat methyltransferase